MNDISRTFDLGDILTVTTGRLVSPRHMDGLYDILKFMAGEDVYTHQLGRVAEEATPVIFHQHPALSSVVCPEEFGGEAAVREWLAQQKRQFGDTLSIRPMNIAEHERIDPLSELAERVHPDRIMAVRHG